MTEGKFVTAINCMDGRTQLPVNEYLRNKFNAEFVDAITEPGPIKFLADNSDTSVIESIKTRVAISVEKHGSTAVGVVCHHGCAGNPVNKEMQLEQLELAGRNIESWGYHIEIVKLWVDDTGAVHEV